MSAQIPITGEQLAALSNEFARLKAQHYGKGPESVKSYVNDDMVFTVMRGVLTTVEQTLVSSGDEELVRTVRLRFQEAMQTAFTDATERTLGRKVIGYQSQIIVDPDMVIEIIVLGDPL